MDQGVLVELVPHYLDFPKSNSIPSLLGDIVQISCISMKLCSYSAVGVESQNQTSAKTKERESPLQTKQNAPELKHVSVFRQRIKQAVKITSKIMSAS